MILLCGIPTEPPMAMLLEQVRRLSVPHVVFDQRQFSSAEIEFFISSKGLTGYFQGNGVRYRLEDMSGVYVRLMDDTFLPELEDEPVESPKRTRCRSLHEMLRQWCEITPARVVNRGGNMASNGSKPFQMQLIRDHGFMIPETLITNDPQLVREFLLEHGRIVYKSISSVRSIVQPLEERDIGRLDEIRWCPIQFQELIEGTNVRVHTVDGKVFPTRVRTEATDYRYAARQVGEEAKLEASVLPDAVAEKCVQLAHSLGLDFAGIDLMITSDGEVFCLEVNPSPAYSYYEGATGQPIAEAVARYLARI